MITPSSIDFATMPSLFLAQRAKLPETSGIYFAIDALGQIQYIGRSVNIRNRWLGHHRKSELEIFDNVRIAWIEIADTTLLDQIERTLIQHFAPPLNGARTQVKSKIDDKPMTQLPTITPAATLFFIPSECVARLTWHKKFGDRLKLARGKVSTDELSERLKGRGISCSPQSLQQIELGEWETVDINLVVAICEEFGKNLDTIIPVLTIGANTSAALEKLTQGEFQ